MKTKAYAKINVGLRVLAKRSDGYHDLDTYFAMLALSDDLELSAEDAERTSVSINGNDGYISGGMDIMEKAALAFSERTGRSFRLAIDIKKNIPVRAGLGGGSSDAAAVMSFLNHHYGSPLSSSELAETALEAGSDVPFFIYKYNIAHGSGRGEVLTPCSGLSEYSDVFILMPDHGNSTGDAFAYLDKAERSLSLLPGLTDSVTYCDFPNDFALFDNALQNAAAKEFSGCFVSLSGSGAAVYILLKRTDDSDSLYRKALSFADREGVRIYRTSLL